MKPNYKACLEDWISRHLPSADAVSVGPISRPDSGHSSETGLMDLSYDLAGKRVTERLVLRTVAAGRGSFPSYDLTLQAGVLRCLEATKVKAPRVRWFEPDEAIIGSPFIVMERIQGETPSDNPPGFHGAGLFFDATEAERAEMWWAVLDQIDIIQSLDWRTLGLPRLIGSAPTREACIREQLSQLRTYLAWADLESVPEIEKGIEWLRTAPIPDGPLVLSWGDARPGNVMYENRQVAGVLDWELASINVPEADVAYLIWTSEMLAERDGRPRISGLPGRSETFQRFAARADTSKETIRFGEMFTLLRLSIMAALGVRATDPSNRQYLTGNVAVRNLGKMLDGGTADFDGIS